MASKSPWSVKGIAPEDREIAKAAARKAGMSVGAWLSSRIQASVEEETPAEEGTEEEVEVSVADPAPALDMATTMSDVAEILSADPMSDQDSSTDASSSEDSFAEALAAGSAGSAGQFPDEPSPSEPEELSPEESAAQRGGDPRFAFGAGQWRNAEYALEDGRFGRQAVPNMPPPEMPSFVTTGLPVQPSPPRTDFAPPQEVGGLADMPGFQAAGGVAPIQVIQVPVEAPSPPPPPPPSAPGVDLADFRALEGKVTLMERMQHSSEDGFGSRFDTLLARVETLSARLDRLADEVDAIRNMPPPEPAAVSADAVNFSTAPIERAVMRLSERLQQVEEMVLPSEGKRRGLFSRMFGRK